jgi:hypothetical protein
LERDAPGILWLFGLVDAGPQPSRGSIAIAAGQNCFARELEVLCGEVRRSMRDLVHGRFDTLRVAIGVPCQEGFELAAAAQAHLLVVSQEFPTTEWRLIRMLLFRSPFCTYITHRVPLRQVEVLRAVRRRWVREFEFSYPRPEGRTDNWDSE